MKTLHNAVLQAHRINSYIVGYKCAGTQEPLPATYRINSYIVGCKFLCGCIPVQNVFGINSYIVGCKFEIFNILTRT